MTRMERPRTEEWAAWVLFLALGGFVGNLTLSLLDHAQNAFFSRFEWVSVVTAAFATSFLLIALLSPRDVRMQRATAWMLGIAAIVGVLGLLLHLLANVHRPGPPIDRIVFGAPVFAPLLFADLAVLGALGLWARQRVAGPNP
jgi:hypothetical protein